MPCSGRTHSREIDLELTLAPMVQWIAYLSPKEKIGVQILVGVPGAFMIADGPSLDKPIPKGSHIVCPNLSCRAHIFTAGRAIQSGDIVPSRHLKALIHSALSGGCPRCGTTLLRYDKRLLYTLAIRSLGDRITHFMYWDENNAANS